MWWFDVTLWAALGTPPSEPAPLAIDEPEALFVSPLSVEQPSEPRWIHHTLRPREKLTTIAARYGVTVEQVRDWNRLGPGEPRHRGKPLRIHARRLPPPQIRIAYVAAPGESWDDVAARLHLRRRALEAANPRLAAPIPGRAIVAWIDPIDCPAFEPDAPAIEWPLAISGDARSTGSPQRGRLEHGIALPPSPLWELAHPTRAYGSSHALTVIHRAFLRLRNETGYRQPIVIGAISRPHGGRFRPHVSHQSGRDVDIRLPLRAGREDVRHARADDIDWYATWAIVDAFVSTGQTEAIFLELGLQERLYTAARAMGVSRERLAEIVRWPNWSGPHDPLVRHSDGHDTHIHVRIRCGPDEPRCRSEAD